MITIDIVFLAKSVENLLRRVGSSRLKESGVEKFVRYPTDHSEELAALSSQLTHSLADRTVIG